MRAEKKPDLGPEMLKDKQVIIIPVLFQLLRGANGPGNGKSTEQVPTDGTGKISGIGAAIGNKIGTAENISQQHMHTPLRKRFRLIFRAEMSGQLTADNFWMFDPKPADGKRIKRFDAVHTAVLLQKRVGNGTDFRIRVMHFELQDQRNLTVYQLQNLLQSGDGLCAFTQTEALQLLICVVPDIAGAAADAAQSVIVENDGNLVFGQLHIQFDAITGLNRQTEGGKRIFRSFGSVIVQAAMCVVETG